MTNNPANLPPLDVARRNPAPVSKVKSAPKKQAGLTRRSAAARSRDTLVQLGMDLRAVTTTTDTREELILRLLEVVVQRTRMLSATWLTAPNDGQLSIHKARFSNPSLDSQVIHKIILDSAATVLKDQTPKVILPDEIRGTNLICVPFFQDDDSTAVLCVMLHDDQAKTNEALLVCQLVVTHFGMWRSRERITRLSFEIRSAAMILELVGKVQCSETQKEAGLKVANELQNLLRCEYVAIGMRKDPAAATRLIAISATADFDHQSRTTLLIKGAFDEAVIRGEMTSFPGRATDAKGLALAHKKLAQQLRCESAISIPLRDQQEVLIGAVTILGSRDLVHHAPTQNLINTLEHPVGSSLQIVRLAEGSWVRKLARKVIAPEKTSTKWAIVAAVLISVIALFVQVSYRINCKCVAEPVQRSFCVAPYEGLLENTYVEPGDVVSHGQLMARMDGRELRFKIAGLVAERERAARKHDSHRANGEIPDALRANLERQRLETELEILRHREQNLEIVSPLAGIVLSGSLDRRQNFPVSIGQTLYEIAPIDPLRVELSVSAEEIMHVEIGQPVKFRFDGYGTETIEGLITRVRPSSTIRDDQNIFVAEAILDNADGEIRPGMKGNAKIYGSKHSLGWTLFHRPWEKIVTAIGF